MTDVGIIARGMLSAKAFFCVPRLSGAKSPFIDAIAGGLSLEITVGVSDVNSELWVILRRLLMFVCRGRWLLNSTDCSQVFAEGAAHLVFCFAFCFNKQAKR